MNNVTTDYVDAVLPRSIERPLPNSACDTHNHIFGPFDAFPLENPPDHAIPLAPVETYLRMLDLAGLERGVLVQPTQQGCRADIMLRALKDGHDRLRGVASAHSDVTDANLLQMQEAGVVGLRFVQAPLPSGAPRPGAVQFDEVPALAGRMRELNWSINVWGRMPTLMEHLDTLLNPGLPVVFEHMGMLNVAEGLAGQHFQTMLALVREGRLWVKLSFCRCSQQLPDCEDLRPFTDALVLANPDQLLWGSDWPFIRMLGSEPDVSDLLEVFLRWVDDDVLREKILAGNPARLYRFEPSGDASIS